MKKLIAALAATALLLSSVAPPAFAGYRYKHSGYGYSSYGGHSFKHRPYYRHGYGYRHHYGYRPHYRRGYGHHYKYRRHRHGHFYGHGHGYAVLGALAGAVVLGTLLSQPSPAPAYAPAYAPPVPRSPGGAPLGSCLQTTGTGTWYGRPAQFAGTMCYDAAGRAYVIRGSERFVGYLQ